MIYNQIDLIARQTLDAPLPDTEAGTFAAYLSGVRDAATGWGLESISAGQAGELLTALERLAGGERLSHAERGDFGKGANALFKELQRTRKEVNNIRLEISPDRGDVPHQSIKAYRDREAFLELLPGRPDPSLNEGRRVERIDLLRWTMDRVAKLEKVADSLAALCRGIGIRVDPHETHDL